MKGQKKLVEMNANILVMILNINGLVSVSGQDEAGEGKGLLYSLYTLENQNKYVKLVFRLDKKQHRTMIPRGEKHALLH